MRILCTNDDGINAPGLAVLEEIARTISDDVWVIAPEAEQSGASRALTLSAPIRVRAAGPKRFGISGTPTDCVLLAADTLMKDAMPDLVLSGVNRGQNIAEDVTMSGTIAAAMQGMQLGIKSIALSLAKGFRAKDSVPWETARVHGPRVVNALLEAGWPDGVVMNVNFPDRDPQDVSDIEVTRQGFRDQHIIYADQRTDLRGEQYYWLGFRGTLSDPPQGTDLRAIYEGRISITPLHIDLTHRAAQDALSAWFARLVT
jgi:5'-nucleotidase